MPYTIPSNAVLQCKSQWCWIAATAMIARRRGIARWSSQCRIANVLFPNISCCSQDCHERCGIWPAVSECRMFPTDRNLMECCNQPGEIERAIEGLSSSLREWDVAIYHDKHMVLSELDGFLDRGGQVVLRVDINNVRSHIVVVFGHSGDRKYSVWDPQKGGYEDAIYEDGSIMYLTRRCRITRAYFISKED